jgi:archaellum component FlaC
MSKLPKRIQAQLQQADAILAAANQAQAEPAMTPAPVAVPEVAPPVEAPPVAQAQTPEPTPTPQVASDPEEKWEARYKTLQGMHNKNIEDMKGRLRAIEQQNQQLAAQLEAATKAQQTPQQPDPKDAEVFGQDLVEMVQRVAENMLGAAAKKIDDRLDEIDRKLTGTTKAVAQTAEEIFLSRLKEAVPDYIAINADPDFLSWLAEADEVYGVPRQSALTAAAEALDADRVAKVFKAFIATKTVTAPSNPPVPAQNTAASELERQIAPNTVASNPTPTSQPTTFRVADVQAFYNDVRLGKYRGREQEAAAIEARINNALAEGRIV